MGEIPIGEGDAGADGGEARSVGWGLAGELKLRLFAALDGEGGVGSFGGAVEVDAEALFARGVIEDRGLEGEGLACFDLLHVGAEAEPLLVDAVVGVVEGEEIGQEGDAGFEALAELRELCRGEAEEGLDVLVDEEGVGHRFEDGEAVEEALAGVEEIAVEEAVIVDAAGGEAVAEEEDAVGVGGLGRDEECAVIEGLAGEVEVLELEFVPVTRFEIAPGLEAGDGIWGEAGHAKALGVHEDFALFEGGPQLGLEVVGGGLGEVGVVVVIVGDVDGAEGFEDAFGLPGFELIDDALAAAIDEDGFTRC